MRVLVVEDEKRIAAFIRNALKAERMLVDVVSGGDAALEQAMGQSYDALILDVMLPGRDGLSVLRELRAQRNNVPVILVTARGEPTEKIEGLNLGADDYLEKPFQMDELIARLHAVVRRAAGEKTSLGAVGDLAMKVPACKVQRGGSESEHERDHRPDTQAPSPWVRAGRRLFSRRIVVGFAGILIGALLIQPRNLFGAHELAGTVISFGFVLVGLLLRAWSAACAGGHTRSAVIEAPRLVTTGPYAHVRNPIYLGSFTLGLGMVGLLGDPWLLVPHGLVFCVFFWMIVPAEERFLALQFGEDYARYSRNVPRFIPSLRPWSGGVRHPLRWSAARGEAGIALLLVCIYGGFRVLLA